jgi:hypothetical protein
MRAARDQIARAAIAVFRLQLPAQFAGHENPQRCGYRQAAKS